MRRPLESFWAWSQGPFQGPPAQAGATGFGWSAVTLPSALLAPETMQRSTCEQARAMFPLAASRTLEIQPHNKYVLSFGPVACDYCEKGFLFGDVSAPRAKNVLNSS